MRFLILLAVMLAILLGLVWIGGEAWLAARARQALTGDGAAFSAAGVDPLPGPTRLGLRIDSPVVGLGALGTLRLAQLDVIAGPVNPAQLRAGIPTDATLDVGGQVLPVALRGAQAGARLSPLSNMALAEAGIAADAIEINGGVLVEGLRADASLTRVAPDAPPRALAAYAVDLAVAGADLSLLPASAGPAAKLPPLSLDGALTLWLTDAPGRGMVSGASEAQPTLIGAESRDGIAIIIAGQPLLLSGRIAAGAGGLAEGAIALDGQDPEGILDLLVDAGIVAPLAAPLVVAGLRVAAGAAGAVAETRAQVGSETAEAAETSAAPVPQDAPYSTAGAESADAEPAETASDTANRPAPGQVPSSAPAASPADAAQALLPAPAAGALRVILRFEGGRIRLGPADLGPAPQLAPPAPG